MFIEIIHTPLQTIVGVLILTTKFKGPCSRHGILCGVVIQIILPTIPPYWHLHLLPFIFAIHVGYKMPNDLVVDVVVVTLLLYVVVAAMEVTIIPVEDTTDDFIVDDDNNNDNDDYQP